MRRPTRRVQKEQGDDRTRYRIGLIASLLGFTSIAGASFAIAKVVARIFLVLFVIILLLARGVGSALF